MTTRNTELLHGAVSGRFDSSKPNQSNTPKAAVEVLPEVPNEALPIERGKRYLLVLKFEDKLALDTVRSFTEHLTNIFEGRGMDILPIILDRDGTASLYELQPPRPACEPNV